MSHRPKEFSKKNYVGVEVECYTKNSLWRLFTLEFNDSKFTEFVTHDIDYSIRAPYNCRRVEFQILIAEDELNTKLKDFFKLLRKYKFKSNRSCGLHVHLDMRNRWEHREVIYNNLFSCIPVMMKLQPESRRNSRWCRKNYYRDFSLQSEHGRKYQAINTRTLTSKSTIEVRVHKGSVSVREITAWVKLLISIANTKEEIKIKKVNNVKQLAKYLPIDKGLTNHMEKRYNKFNSNVA